MLNKNRITKIVATALASFMTLSTLTACDMLGNLTGGGNDSSVEETVNNRGLHQRTVSETNVILAKDSKSDYVIVIAEGENNEDILFAVDELRQNFFKATGATLQTKTDAEISYSTSSTILSIGENALLETAGVTYDKNELGPSGYVVQTKGNSVFMVGTTANASIYAVYGWLSEQFDYEYYSIGETYIEKDLVEEKLLNVNIKEKPDFDYRLTNYGEAWFDRTVAHRSRYNPSGDLWVTFNNVQYHTSFDIVPPETYMEEHPDWYARSGEQLCFTRDPDGLLEVVVERMKQGFAEFPERNIATFTQQDHNSWCDCESCTEAYEYYGTNSAVYLKFVNRVAEEVSEWARETYNGREVLIAMFAYQKTEDAPVAETANGYAPMHGDEELRLHKNVALFYAPIYASYYYTFNDKQNLQEATTLEKWNVLAENLFVWMYGANFRIYIAPYNNFNSMQENYRYLYDKGSKYIFDQQQFNQVSGTDWYKLKAYVSSNLQWQIDQDQTTLINNFFTHYYKDASATMKRLFDEENTWFAHLAEHEGYDGSVGYTYSMLLKENFWPRGLLEGWLALIDQAYKDIEPLKISNPSLHAELTNRIKLESITFRFMQVEMYSVFYSEAQVKEMKDSLKADTLALGVRQYNEQEAMADYWGVA